MMLPRVAALLGLSLSATSGVRVPNELPDVCARYARVEVPAADLPTAADRQRLAGCDSEQLYFGFDKPTRVVDARKCAYLQSQDVTVEKGHFFSAGILAMIYANGRGATRNVDLALKFSCELGGAPAEASERIERLERLKKQGRTGKDFHICDDAGSSAMIGRCAEHEEEFHRVARQRRRDTLISAWRPAEQDAFRELQNAADEFFAASAENEVEQSDARRFAVTVEARAELADGFLKAVEAFEHGRLPRGTPDAFKRADAELNALYRELQAHDFKYGTVNADGIKTAQRVWLRYRDAWVRFGKIKYPAVTADSWRAWLTRERTAMWAMFKEIGAGQLERVTR
jgi:Lysozyme inhibitor LprI